MGAVQVGKESESFGKWGEGFLGMGEGKLGLVCDGAPKKCKSTVGCRNLSRETMELS